ncbi:MAG: TrkA family potassium uptake protein [Eubacteriales bacterium]
MKSFLIVGLGRFGSALALELYALGNEVLVIDDDEDKVQNMADLVTQAVTGNATDNEVLKAVGAKDFDCAVVACGSDVGTSTLITLTLKDFGVPRVVAKANSAVHRKVLEKIGADLVVVPEKEMAEKLAQNLSNNDVLNFIELSDEYAIVEIRVPSSWSGKTIIELNIRATYHLNVLAIRSEGEDLTIAPGGNYSFKSTDSMLVLGTNHDIEKLEEQR